MKKKWHMLALDLAIDYLKYRLGEYHGKRGGDIVCKYMRKQRKG